MKNPTITLADKSQIELNLSTPDLVSHFSNGVNYTGAILEQFNNREYYKQFVDESDKVMLDLGANVGMFAIYATPYCERIVCVEPTPSHFKLLNDLTASFKNIETMQCAVSPVDGFVTFYIEPNNTTMNSLVPRSGTPIMVEGLTLKSIMKRANIEKVDFVKMDIEGSEDLVLNEECLSFIYGNVHKILIEFHNNVVQQVSKHAELFRANGYEVDAFNWDAIMCKRK